MRKDHPEVEKLWTRGRSRRALDLLPPLVMVAALSTTPAFAAPPACAVKAQVAPVNQTVSEGVMVQLNGQPSKNAATYFWEQIGGPAVILSDPFSDKPSFKAPEVEEAGASVVFLLTVTGCSDGTAGITTTVNVTNVVTANQPPTAVAEASPNPAYEGGTVTLDGTASSDPDAGDMLSYSWTQLTGTPVGLETDSSGAIATFAAPNVGSDGGSLKFGLKVTDKGGLTGNAETIVNVQWVNAAPVARVSCPESVNEGAVVELKGSGSTDEDDGIATYEWSQLAGPPTVDLAAIHSSADIGFEAPRLGFHQDGKLPFKLTVTDTGGLSSSAECTVTIKDVTPPEIRETAAIVAEATAASGAAVEFSPVAVDAVDGEVEVTCTPASGSTFPLGVTTVACSASDKAGNAAAANFTVTVQDTTPPVIAPHDGLTTLATSATGAVVNYGYPATTDAVDGAGTAACTPAEGAFPVGITTVTCTATDRAGNAGIAQSFEVWVKYVWNGFFKPIDNSASNAVKAGSAIPVKFSLGVEASPAGAGLATTQVLNLGLDILAAGYPKSAAIVTSDLNVQTISEAETVAAGGSSLTYDPVANQYVYVWKTEKAWAGISRQLQLKLKDGTIHKADFRFLK